MVWKKIAGIILKNSLLVLAILILLSAFMSFEASRARMTFNGSKVLPVTDSAYIRYNQFKKTFGQDATVIVLGIKPPDIFNKDLFNDWYQLNKQIQHIKGIKAVVSVATLYKLDKDTLHHHFVLKPLVTQPLTSNSAADSIKQQILNLPFYKGLVLSEDKSSTLMAITFDGNIVNTPARVPILNQVTTLAKQFQDKHHITVYTSGLPLIRTIVGKLVSHEFFLFLSLSLAITALILLLFSGQVLQLFFHLLLFYWVYYGAWAYWFWRITKYLSLPG